ncbi:MAG: hypothetical protein ACYC6M_03120 [Terriglobales bacterium]
MIDLVPGYDRVPRFQGFRAAVNNVQWSAPGSIPPGLSTAGQPPALVLNPPQDTINVLVENAVVFGGVPLCGYIFITKKGPAAWLAAALGLGIGWLYWQSGPAAQAQAPAWNGPAQVDPNPPPGAPTPWPGPSSGMTQAQWDTWQIISSQQT